MLVVELGPPFNFYFTFYFNGASVNMLSKKIKTDIFNKPAFANRKLIVTI